MFTFNDLRIWLTGESAAPYYPISDYGAGAVVRFTTPSGNVHTGLVDALESDSDGVWLYIAYKTENQYGRKLNMNTSLTIGDVEIVTPAPTQQTAISAVTEIAAR